MFMKRFFLPWLYRNFEHSDLFVFKDYAVIVWSSGNCIVRTRLCSVFLSP